MKYFFDNCLSPRFAQMLVALEVDAIALREAFPADISDEDLFAMLRGSDRVFLTADLSQTTRPLEVRALREAGVTALFLGRFWSKMFRWDQAAWLVRRWPMIDGFSRAAAKGTCAQVAQNGRIHPFSL